MKCNSDSKIANWLFFCCFCVILMVGIGGATRLTKSGLSITDWKPIVGIIPPLNDQEWENEFDKYKEIPEFKQVNHEMNIYEFKKIFFMEYFHRIFARFTLLVCVVPLLVFYLRKEIYSKTFFKLLGIFSLIGVQGLIGWLMVKSGLTERVSVNEFWLAFHLTFAVFVFSLILYQGLKAKYHSSILNRDEHRNTKSKKESLGFLWILTFIIAPFQIFFGGLVAGLHILNLCYGNFDPICKFDFINVVRYHDAMPFLYFHKLFAFILLFGTVIAIFSVLKRQVILKYILAFLMILQIGLGVSILLINPMIGITNYLALIHQINGILVYTCLFVGYFKEQHNV